MIRYPTLLALALAACQPQSPTQQAAQAPANLEALEQAHDWQHEPGDKLNVAFDAGAKTILLKLKRADAIEAITHAGFACEYGEAHQDYPDPMAVCTKEFATRACQMTWEISSTADKGMVDSASGTFRRDCVGTDDDWLDKVNSPIDDQLAPPPQAIAPPEETH
jgi:hypothetical protein